MSGRAHLEHLAGKLGVDIVIDPAVPDDKVVLFTKALAESMPTPVPSVDLRPVDLSLDITTGLVTVDLNARTFDTGELGHLIAELTTARGMAQALDAERARSRTPDHPDEEPF